MEDNTINYSISNSEMCRLSRDEVLEKLQKAGFDLNDRIDVFEDFKGDCRMFLQRKGGK